MIILYKIYIYLNVNIIYLNGKTNLNFKIKTSNCELTKYV